MMILLRRSDKWGSCIIRWATREPASHIGVSFDGINVYHSDFKGCRVEKIEDFYKDSEVFVRHYATPVASMKMRALEKLGSKYDFLGILGFALFLLFKFLGIRAKVPLMNPKWMLCSEYAEYILLGTYSTATPVEVMSKYENSIR
jgi:hypothetical protein